jgi:hypothetical protein
VSAVTIRYYTDPGCPPDPPRTRLQWRHGGQIAWQLRMIGLRDRRGGGWPRERGSDATVHACRAVVAVGLRWPDRQEAMLRHLQALAQTGEPLDDSDTLELAAARSGLPVRELAAYCAAPKVEAALRAEVEAAAGRPCGTREIVAGDLDDLEPRPDPRSVEEVLEWAGIPLTTAEVAAVCGRDVDDELARAARFGGGLWSPRATSRLNRG